MPAVGTVSTFSGEALIVWRVARCSIRKHSPYTETAGTARDVRQQIPLIVLATVERIAVDRHAPRFMQLIERPRISRRTRPANSDSREGVSQNSQSCEPTLLSHVEILNIVVAPNLLSPIIRLAVRDSLVAALAKVGQRVWHSHYL